MIFNTNDKCLVRSNTDSFDGSVTLLWENASPSSEFRAQIIPVDASKYSYFLIKFTTTNMSSSFFTPYVNWGLVKNNAEDTILFSPDLIVSSAGDAISLYVRPCRLITEGIEFYQCICGIINNNSSNITANTDYDETGSYLIPLEIYGVEIQINEEE